MDLATATGVHVKTVSRWENDKQVPEPHHITALAPELGVPEEYFLRLYLPPSAAPRVALGIPQRIRIFIQEFLLELTKAGIPQEEVDATRRILESDELHRVNWGGERDYTEDEILEGIEAHAAAFRQRYRRRGYKLGK
jgi:transcriptional regulator with XRE-family HTH domain